MLVRHQDRTALSTLRDGVGAHRATCCISGNAAIHHLESCTQCLRVRRPVAASQRRRVVTGRRWVGHGRTHGGDALYTGTGGDTALACTVPPSHLSAVPRQGPSHRRSGRVAGLTFDLCENDTLCVAEQSMFDRLYSLCKCVLPPSSSHPSLTLGAACGLGRSNTAAAARMLERNIAASLGWDRACSRGTRRPPRAHTYLWWPFRRC